MRIKSLRQRLAIFLMLPLAAFLVGAGWVGYTYIRDSFLKDWQETTVLRREGDAHRMDAVLWDPIRIMGALAQTGGSPQSAEVQA